ncbi:tetratricopeptide repeat protein [Fibrivirga algicola]|uniref:Tetratricopeptide repeat protein n=1 Tax=Fibrivirga algicola TaxID=2950420 RepID=A0ABX0QCZ9_9BACT|nr:tetratricopeptide repeat protein [Fibrivirga algicola]NID10250.1 tetratricopeptide repeat protein [Fibrivirga algicola]
MMQQLLLSLVLLLVGPLSGYTQDFRWTPGVRRAYSDLTKGRVHTARQALAAEPGSPVNGLQIFVSDYADMIALLSSDNDQLLQQLTPRQAERLDQIDELDGNSPYRRLLLAEVRLHWAFVKLKFGKETAASWDVIKAYKLLAENQRLFPSFLPTYKSLGVLQVMIGSVPDSYAWVPRLLGLRGSIQEGVANLQRAQIDSTFSTEARLAELLIRAYVLRFTKADEVSLSQFVADSPDNLLVRFFAATTAMKNADSEKALAWLTTRPNGAAYVGLPVVENLLGDIYLQKGNYANALTHYGQFLSQYRGQNLLKDSHYKRFLCYWLGGDDTRARAELPRVLAAGRTTVEADKAAQKMAETYLKEFPTERQRVLMQARLASDGGFLSQALAILKPVSEATFQTVAERAEYHYRLGRIHQHLGNVPTAITAFERSIALSDPGQLSFGATSALQLGYLYQQQRNVPRAKQAFEKALSYKRHEYKNSVDNKARAALSNYQ